MELLSYLLKVSACSALFLAFYLLVLRRLTFFKINRFYLLFSLLLSFVIPALHFNLERQVEAPQFSEVTIPSTNQIEIAPVFEGSTTIFTNVIPVKEAYNCLTLLPYCYGLIVVALLCLAGWRLFQLLQHAKKNTKEVNGLKLVSKSAGFTNCSFFNYVFIDENSLTANELQVLLAHEKIHAKQFHSVDKIILMVAKAVLWFNPIVYLYDKALEQTHEFEADEATSQNFGTQPYANLLLRLAISKSEMPLVHNFVKSPIKERIKMLFNSKSKDMKKLIYLLALPIGLGLLWGFTVDVVEVSNASTVTEIMMSGDKALKTKNPKNDPLWNKTIRGKVKSILQTEVGEVLNFKYDKGVVRILNSPKVKVSVGDEILVTINGTVNDLKISDAKGNVITQLDASCYSISMVKTINGKVLYSENNRPFLSKDVFMQYGEFKSEKFTLHTISGKTPSVRIERSVPSEEPSEIYIIINGKLYIEKETLKFDKKFIASLSEKRGFSKASDYKIPAIVNQNNAYVFWFGTEPKLSASMAKNRSYYKKYNGKTVEGKVVGFTYSSSKVIDGFLVNTANGETLKAKVEKKFATQTEAMIAKGDNVSIKIYNANYIQNSEYPVLTSYKISKGGKLLYDRWPRVASIKSINVSDVKVENRLYSKSEIPKPILVSATKITVDTKNNINYIKNGVMTFGKETIVAEEMIFDKTNLTLKSSHASIKSKDGTFIVGDNLFYDFKNIKYTIKRANISSPSILNKPEVSTAQKKIKTQIFPQLAKNERLDYTAKDSIRTNKLTGEIYLYGSAQAWNEKTTYKGDLIIYNGKQQTLKVKSNAAMYDKSSKSYAKADSISMDLKTSKGMFYGGVYIMK